eukprot:TRINITY_DN3775_c0_g1_i2.p1 TRINITY_DN3775_c0_g1~~TRINITY_DN3775_c0_g1_i2.p1  ORF type:complete len:354 (-),score=91.21 TRINITY_DN3775_c0_g1_i2:473-1432(-)
MAEHTRGGARITVQGEEGAEESARLLYSPDAAYSTNSADGATPAVAEVGVAYQSSLLTIFSVWNTMMGTALLSLPWGFALSGIAGALGAVLVMGVCTWYTVRLVMLNGFGKSTDFIDVCAAVLGRPGRYVAWFGSVLVLLGAGIIYFILMSSNLQSLVEGIVARISDGDFRLTAWWGTWTVPAYAFIIMLPLLNLRDFSVFVRINSVGILWVLYVIVFIIISSAMEIEPGQQYAIVETKCLYLAGILSLSFFAHNFVLNVTQKSNPRYALRDVTIGFCLSGVSYTIVGLIGYIGLVHRATTCQVSIGMTHLSQCVIAAS